MTEQEKSVDMLIKENKALFTRLSHLLKSKTISLFDEVDPVTGEYRRHIGRLDTYGVHDKILKFEKQHGVGHGLPGHIKPEHPDPEPPKLATEDPTKKAITNDIEAAIHSIVNDIKASNDSEAHLRRAESVLCLVRALKELIT